MLRAALLVMMLSLPVAAHAADKTHTISGGTISVPVGLTVQVKEIRIGPDATKVRLLASFDSSRTNSVNLNDEDNAYLAWGDGETERLHMRQVSDNKWMRIANGQSMEGDLIFPGVLPAGTSKVTLVFNPGRDGTDTNGPGVRIPLELK